MSKRMLFVFNPLSGKGNIKNKLSGIIDTFVKCGWEITVRPTQGIGDAFTFVRDNAQRFQLLVLSGGDGTLNEGIRGIMSLEKEKRPSLGYIPAGTTNDFAANMKISKNMKKAAQDIMNGDLFDCDIGSFNDKNFVYVAAFGAFTDVAYDTPQQNKNMLGHLAYILEGAKRLPNIKAYPLQVVYDGGTVEGEFIYGMVSNTNYLGGIKAEKAFKAELNDGLFEIILVRNPKNIIETQNLLACLVTQELNPEYFTVIRSEKVKFVSDEAIPWTLDGEFGGAVKEAVVLNKKQAVTLVLPKKKI
ncbi:MAG: YegS/Rv2252/BmrU family lipid kinase [Clostridia bacterium]|nr:YegS/Rv2252/BmrU family lipid kinase [Clostridia bacterium]